MRAVIWLYFVQCLVYLLRADNTKWKSRRNAENLHIPTDCTQLTTSDYAYREFFPVEEIADISLDGTFFLPIRVMTKSDAHILLSSNATDRNPVYEIVIGGSANTKSNIRRNKGSEVVFSTSTVNIVSVQEYRQFWISYRQRTGELEVGVDRKETPFMYYKDPTPLNIMYVSFSSWTGIIGKWILGCNGTDAPAQGNRSMIEKLRKDLLDGYDKHSRPVQDHGDTTVVKLGLSLLHINMKEKESQLVVDVWITMSWIDQKLTWDESQYGNLSILRIPDHKVWQPDILLYNNADNSKIDLYGNTHVLLFNTGKALWVPPARLSALCNIDLTYWPWDEQTCYLKFGSWTHDGRLIDLELFNNHSEIDFIDFWVSNAEWKVTETNVKKNVKKYSCCEESYPDITFTLKLMRQSPTYMAVILVPIIVIVLLTLVVFWLPQTSAEKVVVGSINFLVLCIFLLYFGSILPARSNCTPAIVMFYSSTTVLVGLSILTSVIVISLSRRGSQNSLPHFVKNALIKWLGKGLCLRTQIKEVYGIPNHLEHLELKPPEDEIVDDRWQQNDQVVHVAHAEWFLVAAALNRMMFFLYCIVFVVLMVIFF